MRLPPLPRRSVGRDRGGWPDSLVWARLQLRDSAGLSPASPLGPRASGQRGTSVSHYSVTNSISRPLHNVKICHPACLHLCLRLRCRQAGSEAKGLCPVTAQRCSAGSRPTGLRVGPNAVGRLWVLTPDDIVHAGVVLVRLPFGLQHDQITGGDHHDIVHARLRAAQAAVTPFDRLRPT